MWEKVKGDVDVVSVTQQLKHLPAFGGNSIASECDRIFLGLCSNLNSEFLKITF